MLDNELSEQEILSIEIEHSKPLELKQFTASMLAIESQYCGYLMREGLTSERLTRYDYSLLLQEVRPGSIVVKFIKGLQKRLFEHVVLPGFVKYFGDTVRDLIDQKVLTDTGRPLHDLKELHAIADVISNDYGAKMNISAEQGSQIIQNFNIDGVQANAITNECARQLDNMQQSTRELFEGVVLHWKQAGENRKSLSIDKGIIEEIDERRKVQLICSEDLKNQMVSTNERNPFNMYFIVDVEVKRVQGKPVAYIIKKIHHSGSV